jgi:DNA transposition AAA+ family ATPase
MVTTAFREKVREAVLSARQNYGGTDGDFAKTIGISGSIYSRLKKGEHQGLLSDTQWINVGRILDVQMNESKWKVARTTVYEQIEDSVKFCQDAKKSMILVDDCGIGKTFCVRHVIKSLKNAFYVDCSQAKTKQQFIRLLAKTIGVDYTGRYVDVKANLKYFLNLIENPFIALDEAGDLDYGAFLELKELWNATSGSCGWFMIGADGLRAKIRRGINNEKVGYREIFSRFSDEFITIVPAGKDDKNNFYRQLFEDVALVNSANKENIATMVKKAIQKEASLRYLETLIKMQ